MKTTQATKRAPSGDFQAAMRLISGCIPCVPLFIPHEWRAAWSGKWSCNVGCEGVKAMGGPWNTRDEACAAILATGRYQLRPGTENNPHFDSITA